MMMLIRINNLKGTKYVESDLDTIGIFIFYLHKFITSFYHRIPSRLRFYWWITHFRILMFRLVFRSDVFGYCFFVNVFLGATCDLNKYQLKQNKNFPLNMFPNTKLDAVSAAYEQCNNSVSLKCTYSIVVLVYILQTIS